MLRDFFHKEEPDEPLEKQIAAIYKEMAEIGVDHGDYPTLLTSLERYYELKAKKKQRRASVSWDTVIGVGGNLLGIAIIVIVEQTHVMNSKGLNLLYRPKTT